MLRTTGHKPKLIQMAVARDEQQEPSQVDPGNNRWPVMGTRSTGTAQAKGSARDEAVGVINLAVTGIGRVWTDKSARHLKQAP